jgi:uncharacterized protein (TIGR03083 family)
MSGSDSHVLEVRRYVDFLSADGELLAAAAAQSGLDTPVPSCPEWVVRDLVRHIAGIHRWATSIVATPRDRAWDVELDEVVGAWPTDVDLVDWYLVGHRALVRALQSASPHLECWTFLRAASPLAMWARRQAHETAMHRVDAQQAASGRTSPIDAAFAADGTDELLACFITRKSSRLHADLARAVRVIAADTNDAWDVHFGAGPVTTVRNGDDIHADAILEGDAADLYLTLWHRRGLDGLSVTGDASIVEAFLDDVRVRWS